MDNIKVIICDLDGTLYQDRQYYKRFISHLLKGSVFEEFEALIQAKADAIIEGKDKVLLGHLYDRTMDLTGKTLEERLDIESIVNTDGHFENYLDRKYGFIGDGWSIVFMLAGQLGIAKEVVDRAFAKVREEMLMPEYAIEVNEQLVQVLGELAKYTEGMYMMTNTARPEAIDFTKYINLEDKFNIIHYGADKPFGLMEHLPDILKNHHIEGSEILAIGDHGYNDLYPVKAIGGHTILTSPYDIHDHVDWSVRVHTLEQLKEQLEEVLAYCKKRESA